MDPPIKTIDIELGLSVYFDYVRNIVVPGISRGLVLYEMDVLVIRPSGWGIEIEIKVSRSDLKRDLEKKHTHNDPRIRELYFAVPEALVPAAFEFAPETAGILSCAWHETLYSTGSVRSLRPTCVRWPARNPYARKFTEAEQITAYRLGAIRLWTIKKQLQAERLRSSPMSSGKLLEI